MILIFNGHGSFKSPHFAIYFLLKSVGSWVIEKTVPTGLLQLIHSGLGNLAKAIRFSRLLVFLAFNNGFIYFSLNPVSYLSFIL